MKRLILLVVVSVALPGCAHRVTVESPDRTLFSDRISLYSHPLELRISKPVVPQTGYLVLFATGDGGWHRLDEDLFDWISACNLPVVGFSSKNYLKNLGYVSDDTTTTPRRLMRDLEQVISAAERKLGLPPDTRIILVGMSRGAGLTVVAAGVREMQVNLAGVVAIALTREEEHVVRYRPRRDFPPVPRGPRQLVEIKTYDYLRRLAAIPIAVIQSTHDRYLPATEARRLFGPDTAVRKLQEVESRGHTFGGALKELRNRVESSLLWIEMISRQTSAGS